MEISQDYANLLRKIKKILDDDSIVDTKDLDIYSLFEYENMLYRSMNRKCWHEEFVFAADRMLAHLGDRKIRLVVSENECWKPFSAGFHVRRHEDTLYVTQAQDCSGFRAGDRITAVDGRPIEEYLPFVRRWLYGKTQDTELWDTALESVSRVTVETKNGLENRSVRHCPPDPPSREERSELLPGRIVYLRLNNFSYEQRIRKAVDDVSGALETASALILDLRGNIGGFEQAFFPLLPYIADRSVRLSELLGEESEYTNYTEDNCRRLCLALKAAADRTPENTAMCQNMTASIQGVWGKGIVLEQEEWQAGEDLLIEPRGPEKVAVLIDSECEDTAERFAKIAQKSGRTTLLGRPTLGNSATTDLIEAEIGAGCSLLYPISMLASVRDGKKRMSCEPDIPVPWIPRMLDDDIDLTHAQDWCRL